MNNKNKRMWLFLGGCIGSRLALVYLAKTVSLHILSLIGYVTLMISFGFAYIYMMGLRKTGPETFGQPIWWNHLRPIHSLLYFLFSYHAIYQIRSGWVYLLADVVLGFVSFIAHHFFS